MSGLTPADQPRIDDSKDRMIVNYEMICVERNIEPTDEKQILFLLGVVYGIDECKRGIDDVKKAKASL